MAQLGVRYRGVPGFRDHVVTDPDWQSVDAVMATIHWTPYRDAAGRVYGDLVVADGAGGWRPAHEHLDSRF